MTTDCLQTKVAYVQLASFSCKYTFFTLN